MRNILLGFLLIGTLTSARLPATAQEVVHALAGTVTAIYPKSQTIQIKPDDGSDGLFDVLTDNGKKTQLAFDKDVEAVSTPAASYTKTQSHVLVFYFGDVDERTTVALEDLGPGPFVETIGTFVKVDKHAHQLIIRCAAGNQTFNIDAKTVGEASEGVVTGEKFSVDKGAQIKVLATTANGVQTALFIRALSL